MSRRQDSGDSARYHTHRPPRADEVEHTPPPQSNRGPVSVPFRYLAHLFESLQRERTQDRRRKLLLNWFNRWRKEIGNDLYPLLRLIIPQKDRERAGYGMRESILAKAYVDVIALGKKDPDAIRLQNWKKPSEHDKASGDFASVLYEVINKRSSVFEGSLTIQDVNEILDALSKAWKLKHTQTKLLQRFYDSATPNEQRWIVRIILKDLTISVKETTIFSVFHPDAQDLFNTCSDLKKVAWTLWDPSVRLDSAAKQIRLMHAFTPMLCKRPTKSIEQTVKEMGGDEFYIEEKLDGERMQLHKKGEKYFYCSRKGTDYTHLYGKDPSEGSLTPFIHKVFDPKVKDIILDGEMLVWDPSAERYLPFGNLKEAALLANNSEDDDNPRPCFKIFDLLYLNGHSLIERSLAFRKRNLRSCLKEIKGRVEFAEELIRQTAQEVRERMEEVMRARGEGLVLKHPRSKYVLNGRNWDWIKVKPEYMDNLGETFDVLVVGANYGTGVRGGQVSSLICGVLDDRRRNDGDPIYSTFVRVGTGFSFADYRWIREKPWKPRNLKSEHEWLQMSSTRDDKGDVYLEPQESFILKVKASEIIVTDQYHLGITLRFPRCLAIRKDLDVADCVTATEVLASLRSDKKRKYEDGSGTANKKRKTKTKTKIHVLDSFKPSSMKGVDVVSDVFADLRLVVWADPTSRTGEQEQARIAKIVHENGGRCVSITSNHVNLIVYDGTSAPIHLQQFIEKGDIDVVKSVWISDSVKQGYQVPKSERYLFSTLETRTETTESQDADTTMGRPDEESHCVEEACLQTRRLKAERRVAKEALDSDWVKLGETESSVSETIEYDLLSDHDSENEGMEDDELVFGDDAKDEVEDEGMEPPTSHIEMGESDQAIEYDQEKIFRHLCFYLDSPENAAHHGMAVKTKCAKDINLSFNEIKALILEHGGRIVDLDEPKLTHILLDKRDAGRRLMLRDRTASPKLRNLVVTEYVHACVEEETLLDEDDYKA